MLAHSGGQDGLNDTGQAADHGGQVNFHDLHTGGHQLAVLQDEGGGQNAHQHGSAHQGGAHHESGTGMEVDDLLVHLGGGAVVDEQSHGNAQHEGHIGGEHIPDQQGDDSHGQQQVEGKQLGTGQLLLFGRLALSQVQGSTGRQTGAPLLLLEAGQNGVGQSQDNAEDLDGDDGVPQSASLNAQHGSGTHGGTGPGHQVQHAHGQHGDPQQAGGTHVHLLVDGQHSGHHNAEGGGSAAVQVADQGDDAGHNAHAHHVVADELQQLADDHVKHTGIGHNAEVQHGEHEQGGGRSGRVKTGLDHSGQVVEGDPAPQDQDQAQDSGVHDEGNSRLSLALKQGGNNGHDGHKAKQADNGITHFGDSFLSSNQYVYRLRGLILRTTSRMVPSRASRTATTLSSH